MFNHLSILLLLMACSAEARGPATASTSFQLGDRVQSVRAARNLIVLGDSISRATNSDMLDPNPEEPYNIPGLTAQQMSLIRQMGLFPGSNPVRDSWAAGTRINSIAERLAANGVDIAQRVNVSMIGATSFNLPQQAASAAALTRGNRNATATIQIGANDMCRSTGGSVNLQAVSTAIRTLVDAANTDTILIASVPDMERLYNLVTTSPTRTSYGVNYCTNFLGINVIQQMCPRLAANPSAFNQRVIAANQTLQQAANNLSGYKGATVKFDGNATYNTQFADADVSVDCFHPSTQGQEVLADSAAIGWGI